MAWARSQKPTASSAIRTRRPKSIFFPDKREATLSSDCYRPLSVTPTLTATLQVFVLAFHFCSLCHRLDLLASFTLKVILWMLGRPPPYPIQNNPHSSPPRERNHCLLNSDKSWCIRNSRLAESFVQMSFRVAAYGTVLPG